MQTLLSVSSPFVDRLATSLETNGAILDYRQFSIDDRPCPTDRSAEWWDDHRQLKPPRPRKEEVMFETSAVESRRSERGAGCPHVPLVRRPARRGHHRGHSGHHLGSGAARQLTRSDARVLPRGSQTTTLSRWSRTGKSPPGRSAVARCEPARDPAGRRTCSGPGPDRGVTPPADHRPPTRRGDRRRRFRLGDDRRSEWRSLRRGWRLQPRSAAASRAPDP